MRRATLAKIGFFERVVFDFKTHHPRPLTLGQRSFIEQIKSTLIFLFPLTVLLNLACWYVWMPAWLLTAIDVTLVGALMTPHFHSTLHRKRNSGIIDAMRRTGLLMTPAMHEIHDATLDRDFATLNGWSNPLVNVIFRELRRQGRLDPVGLEAR